MTETDRAGLARTNNLLKEKLLRWMPGTGDYPTAIEGLTIHRRDEANQPENCFYKPLVAVIVQGFKRSIIGSRGVPLRGESLPGKPGWTCRA